MNTSFFKYSSIIVPVIGAVMFISLTSCSDEDIINRKSSDRRISFDVMLDGEWTRSGSVESEGSISTVSLQAGSEKLYLIPEVSKGINCKINTELTRGTSVTSDNMESFGVYASNGGGEAYYMLNEKITKENSWGPDKEYLWPGSGKLHINAYSPYAESAEKDGITSLPSEETSNLPQISYKIPEDVTLQTDLLWATPVDANSSPCALTFNHALSAIRFVTGAEMTPCVVKSISISGVPEQGVLNIENGVWSNVEGKSSFTVDLDKTLTAEEGEKYVNEKSEITDPDHTFMLLPGTLGEDAAVTLTIDYNGTPLEFTASLSGQTWNSGNTYTYMLSANPELDRFVISVESPLSFNYTGGTKSYTVKSIHERIKNGVLTSEEVPWKAEFVDENGNTVSQPSWISSMLLSGNGSMSCKAITDMVDPDFVTISEPSRHLRQMSAVGSKESPYNLSNSTGGINVENTANCYVINAPGTYSLPLVYGNAIKDGVDNTAAYLPTRSSEPFVNHLGNRITHPYIYDNTGCSNPKEACLIWEGRLNLVRNVRLSDDGKSIVFDIPSGSIRQGNAVVGLKDQNGNTMWSWQLWITDYIPGNNLHSMSYNGHSFEIMPYNLGRIVGGDETDFASNSAKVRFTQLPADGSRGESVTIIVEQTGKHVITPDCYSFYQWGRKDPMISGIKEWYYADHTEITEIDFKLLNESSGPIGTEFETELIRNPQSFWIFTTTGYPSFKYTNNWNSGTSLKAVKTVYDPCPVGFMVPGNELMTLRDMDTSNFSFISYGGYSDPARFVVRNSSDGTSIVFPALGYRSAKTGMETMTSNGASMTELWTSHSNRSEAAALIMTNSSNDLQCKMPTDGRLEGFGIRPVKE